MKSNPIQTLTKKQLSKKEREERQRRLLYSVVGVTALAVIAVLALGLYQEYVAKPAAPIAVVNGKTISTRDYQAMYSYRRLELTSAIGNWQSNLAGLDATSEEQQFLVQYVQSQISNLESQLVSLPTTVLDDMVADELVRQEAGVRGIAVTSDELQEYIEQQFGYQRNTPTPVPTSTPITETLEITATPTPTEAPMTLEQFQTNYSQYVSAVRTNAGFSEQAFRSVFEASLYRRKLQEALEREVPTTAEQIHARHILVQTEEEAAAVLERLKAGEDFAAVAGEVSTDTTEGGDLGWFPRGQMVTEFENAAFALQPGETSGIVPTSYGYHIIQVLEREAERALDETALEQAKSMALDNWLAAATVSEGVQKFWSSDKVPEVD